MASAFRIDDNFNLTQTDRGGYGTVLYWVEDLPFAAHGIGLVQATDGLPDLGSVAPPDLGLGYSYARARSVVQIVNDTTAIYAIRYAPLSLSGMWVRRGAQASTSSDKFAIPRYFQRQGGIWEYADFPYTRARSRRVESRKIADLSVQEIQQRSCLHAGKQYSFGQPPLRMVFEGSDVWTEGDGTIRVSSIFSTEGPVPPFGVDQGFDLSTPGLDYLDQFYHKIDASGNPVVGIVRADDLYPQGEYSDLPWLTL